jgi:hypothetical protein
MSALLPRRSSRYVYYDCLWAGGPTLTTTQPGDIVALQHGQYGRTEGLVVGSHVDYAVRPIPSFPSHRVNCLPS